MKKKMKKAQEDALGFVGLGMGTAIGGEVLGSIGGDIAGQAGQGLSNLSGQFPAMGTIMGGKLTLGLLSEMGDMAQPKRRRRKRR